MSHKDNIFDKLREDHNVQRELLSQLLKTSGDSEDRKRIYYELKKELEEHAKFEEREFYTRLLQDDLTQEKARHAIAEHKQIDDVLEVLEDTEMSAANWLVLAKKLDHLVNHHLDEEENEFFQMAGKVLTEKEKVSFGKNYRKNMEESFFRTNFYS